MISFQNLPVTPSKDAHADALVALAGLVDVDQHMLPEPLIG